jgi:predicted RNase H-like nuclease (RuvC/YqgF family)
MIEAKNEEIQELHDAYEKLRKVKQPFFENNHYKTLYLAEEVQNKNYKKQLEKTEKDRDILYSNVELHLKEIEGLKIDNVNLTILVKSKELVIENDIEQLQNTIKERENEIREADNEIENLENRLRVYKAKEIMTKQEIKSDTVINTNNSFPPEPYFYRDLTPQERMGKEPLNSKSSKTFKLFGIPIFTIDNK